MIYILLKKEEPIYTITKSLNQCPNIHAQTSSDEIQQLENYENSTVALTVCIYENNQAILIWVFFKRWSHNDIDICYISQSYFTCQKKQFVIFCIISILFRETIRDVIILLHDIAGLVMNLEEWKHFCPEARENKFKYLQIDRFAKRGEGRYIIRNGNRTIYRKSIPETKPF